MTDQILERLAVLEALFEERTSHIDRRLSELASRIELLDEKLDSLERNYCSANCLSRRERYSLYGAIITALISAIVSIINTAISCGLIRW